VRGRPRQQCPRRGKPQERREIARAEDPEGKARSAQNALKHGMRAQKYLVLPEEDTDEFAGLEAAMVEELAPVGALQTMLARRVAIAAWRLARADRFAAGTGLGPVPQPGGQQVDLFAEQNYGARSNPGLALIRDGNGTRSFETLMRYRGCGDGRVLARVAHTQGAPGRAGDGGRS
jgi:hypothetical protein